MLGERSQSGRLQGHEADLPGLESQPPAHTRQMPGNFLHPLNHPPLSARWEWQWITKWKEVQAQPLEILSWFSQEHRCWWEWGSKTRVKDIYRFSLFLLESLGTHSSGGYTLHKEGLLGKRKQPQPHELLSFHTGLNFTNLEELSTNLYSSVLGLPADTDFCDCVKKTKQKQKPGVWWKISFP